MPSNYLIILGTYVPGEFIIHCPIFLPFHTVQGVLKARILKWFTVVYQIDYILCSHRWRSFIQSAKTRPGADYGSDHELLIAKFRLKFKKVGKITRPFRNDLNEIPYDYIVEMRNRFKGLDLIEFLKNYGLMFMTLYRRQWSR